VPKGLPDLPSERVGEMEAWMDAAEQELPELRVFVLPGGTPGAAALHLARTVCRRAERAVVHLAGRESVDKAIVVYLNRLSDLLFMLARVENHRSGAGDVEWKKE
jgi:cob(I)alamin adenosyltransferase